MHRLYDAALPDVSAKPPPGIQPRLAIRQLIPSDELVVSHLLCGLDPKARLERFGLELSDIALEAHARTSLATSPAVFGALIDSRLAGVAEINLEPYCATLAFAVDAAWRRQGIGCRLLLAALAWAAEQDITSVRLQCTRTNWAVRQIAHKANARIDLAGGKFLAEFDARPDIPLARFAHAH